MYGRVGKFLLVSIAALAAGPDTDGDPDAAAVVAAGGVGTAGAGAGAGRGAGGMGRGFCTSVPSKKSDRASYRSCGDPGSSVSNESSWDAVLGSDAAAVECTGDAFAC